MADWNWTAIIASAATIAASVASIVWSSRYRAAKEAELQAKDGQLRLKDERITLLEQLSVKNVADIVESSTRIREALLADKQFELDRATSINETLSEALEAAKTKTTELASKQQLQQGELEKQRAAEAELQARVDSMTTEISDLRLHLGLAQIALNGVPAPDPEVWSPAEVDGFFAASRSADTAVTLAAEKARRILDEQRVTLALAGELLTGKRLEVTPEGTTRVVTDPAAVGSRSLTLQELLGLRYLADHGGRGGSPPGPPPAGEGPVKG